jgi:LmbE family N-acetylglucosaminyl deacetylase
MTDNNQPLPERALAVMAHPDDVEFMAGGTMARWARAGVELHYCLITDGNAGSRDPSLTPERLAELRRIEQRRAADMLGVASCTFLGYHDGRLIDTLELRLQIARVIRQVRPDTVVTSDPLFYYSPWYINHPDHRAAGLATMAAVMPLANTRLAAPELLEAGLEPHDVTYVYLASAAQPTYWSALEQQDFEQKLATLAVHESQMGNWDFRSMAREFAEQQAAAARMAGVECGLAESFVVVNLGGRPGVAPEGS